MVAARGMMDAAAFDSAAGPPRNRAHGAGALFLLPFLFRFPLLQNDGINLFSPDQKHNHQINGIMKIMGTITKGKT
jgi:hypothetical protein